MMFRASYDRTTKIISTVVCLGLLGVIVAVHNIVLACLSLLVMLIAYAFSPRGYRLEGRSILVTRLAGTPRIALDDVREIRRAAPEDFQGCIRLGGSGGLFGYYGLFSTTRLGKCTWYVTNRSKSVVVITAAKTALFSPDDPDAFVAAIRAYAPVMTSSAPLSVAPARSFSGVGKMIAFAVALLGMGFGIVAYNYSPGAPSFTLTREALTIHDRLYPVTLQASSVYVDRIRIVDLDQDSEWRPTKRTNGFANSHYQSGWFQVASGEKVRLYRAGSRRLVLIPPLGDGTAVLYQAADPEKFVNQIRAEWGATARSSAKAGKWIHYAL